MKIKILPKGTVLYSGSKDSTDMLPDPFMYVGQYGKSSKEFPILYASTDENVAYGYANGCVSTKFGWIKKYVSIRDIPLYDATNDQEFFEAEEVKKDFCPLRPTIYGYYVAWGFDDTKAELAVCDPQEILRCVAMKPCSTGIWIDF